MGRAVIAGAALIAASVVLAVVLNHSAVQENAVPPTDADRPDRAEKYPAVPVRQTPAESDSLHGAEVDCCRPEDDGCPAKRISESRAPAVCRPLTR
jgi:hypothetical protein